MNDKKEKVLLDTDIGTEIDDAMCLAYLLAHPDCELMGIVTGTGEACKRAMIASALCKAVGFDIPIYPGAEMPLLKHQILSYAPQAEMLNKWEHQKSFPQGEAVEFMRQVIRANPGEVTLLGIGPLTNIALLFCADPEIPQLLKRLVLMSGSYTYQSLKFLGEDMKALSDKSVLSYMRHGLIELNAFADPHATAIVYNADVKVHRSTSVDVTHELRINADQARREFTSGVLVPVLDMAEFWFQEDASVSFNDPLAAISIFTDDIVTFQRGDVTVELDSDRLSGLTYWNPGSDGKHEISTVVDKEKFFDHLFKILK